jgi:hypothetical protein
MKHYTADEFLFNLEETPVPKAVDKKVSLLYDFCILTKRKSLTDRRENAVRLLLGRCPDEYAMTHLLRDVLLGHCTLDELLDKKGVM